MGAALTYDRRMTEQAWEGWGAEEVSDAVVVAPPEQTRHRVWRHPDRERIHYLFRAGKSASWISLWLEDTYPLTEVDEDDEEVRHPDYRRHKRLQISAATLTGYRNRFMPECAPGIDVVSAEVEDMVGRVFPAPAGRPWELDVIAAQVRVAEQMLVTQMQADQENNMGVSETAVDLSRVVVEHASRRFDAARSIALPGYEPAVERQAIEMDVTQRGVSIELTGRIDQKTGRHGPLEPKKVDLMARMLERGPDAVLEMVSAAKAVEAAMAPPDDPASDGSPADGETG